MRTAARRDSFTYATFNFNKLSPESVAPTHTSYMFKLSPNISVCVCVCVVLSRLTIANTVDGGGRERLVSCSVRNTRVVHIDDV